MPQHAPRLVEGATKSTRFWHGSTGPGRGRGQCFRPLLHPQGALTVQAPHPALAPSLALIDGLWCGAGDGATFAVVDPASGEEIARMPDMGAAEAECAVAVAAGGKPHGLGGLFYEPTVILDATIDMLVAKEETFGPVAPFGGSNSTASAARARATARRTIWR